MKGGDKRRYCGVDRVPVYEVGHERRTAMERFVFGNMRDKNTNLITSFSDAIELRNALVESGEEYEVLFCCENKDEAMAGKEPGEARLGLGFDIAVLRGDYWSIVGDMAPGLWAERFRCLLNEHGLFDQREDAERYLVEYRMHGEADSEYPFQVLFVARVIA